MLGERRESTSLGENLQTQSYPTTKQFEELRVGYENVKLLACIQLLLVIISIKNMR